MSTIGDMLRNNPLRKKYLQVKQANYLAEVVARKDDRVVVFLVPGRDRVNGGILSIVSLAEESAVLKDRHGAAVFVCTVPWEPPLLRYTKFANRTTLVDFLVLLRTIRKPAKVLVHIPEIFVARFAELLPPLQGAFPGIAWQFNILLQNIDSIPKKDRVLEIATFGQTTCTTAHKAYCNAQTEELLGCAVSHFSVWCSPEKYLRKSYAQKENLVVVSPDKHPQRKEVLDSLRARMPGYRFQVIKKLTYEQYKELIASAKFSLTFGEGLDGYLVEPVFSGGIGAAVYNDRFFTEELKPLPFIYGSMEELQTKLPLDIAAADCEDLYLQTHLRQFEMFASYYSHESYVANLARFYQERFPAPDA